MNIYKALNEVTKYIDDNLDKEIDYNHIARILGVNVYTMQRLFAVLTNITLSDYIRRRRMSSAGFDLYKGDLKVIDVAVKYGYDSSESFSRAFQKFHGIKPSMVKKNVHLNNFPRIIFDENIIETKELNYEIVELDELNLYGKGIKTSVEKIGLDAPSFYKTFENNYKDKYGNIDYGIITYDEKRDEVESYKCAYNKKIDELDKITIPKSKYLKFTINSENPKDIQEMSHKFYREFLPSCKYNLKPLPELEYYHDNITDFLVAIY